MKILITGASGFIGKNLLNNLSEKYKIALITKKKIKNKKYIYIKSDLSNIKKYKKKILKFEPKILIHLAWEGIPDLGKINSKKNSKDQLDFFKFIIRIKSIKRIIVTGSCLEYGSLKGKIKEDRRIRNYSHFSKAKLKIYNFLKKNLKRKTKLVWLRLFYVYGKLQREDALIPYIINKIKEKKEIYLQEPYSAKDFVNVNDVCKAILIFIENNKSGVFNVGTGIATNPLQIVKIISKLKKVEFSLKYKNNKKSSFYADTKKINKCGWKPDMSFIKYIKNLIKNK